MNRDSSSHASALVALAGILALGGSLVLFGCSSTAPASEHDHEHADPVAAPAPSATVAAAAADAGDTSDATAPAPAPAPAAEEGEGVVKGKGERDGGPIKERDGGLTMDCTEPQADGGAACLSCCGAASPAGAKVFAGAIQACACQPSVCGTECGSTCTDGGMGGMMGDGGHGDGGASAACLTCIQTKALTNPLCLLSAQKTCSTDATCTAFQACTMTCGGK